MKIPRYASLNGRIVPWEQATLQVFSPAAKYGIGAFEGIRGYWSEAQSQLYLFRLEEHFERLALSERAMRLRNPFSREQMRAQVLQLIEANDFRETIHIRLMSFLDGPNEMKAEEPVGMAITAVARPAPPELSHGLRAQVSSWTRIPDRAMPARIKCNANYHNGRLATLQAVADGYDVPLMLNMRGDLAEAPAACVFLVRKGRLITPPLHDDVLESITRDTLLTLCREQLRLDVQERTVNRSELYAADEAMLVGSGAEVTPIISIDRLPVGDGVPGSVTRRVQAAYFEAALGRIAAYSSWCTPACGQLSAAAPEGAAA